jgi:hypothetical protein
MHAQPAQTFDSMPRHDSMQRQHSTQYQQNMQYASHDPSQMLASYTPTTPLPMGGDNFAQVK